MKFLEKIETFLNSLILIIGQWCLSILKRFIPQKIILNIKLIESKAKAILPRLKYLPSKLLAYFKAFILRSKEKLSQSHFQSQVKIFFINFSQRSKDKNKSNTYKVVKELLVSPLLWLGRWLGGLSTSQSLLLLSFSAASILSGVSIIFSGKRVLEQHIVGRSPSSVEETVQYERPSYYKKQTKHVELTNLRIPVFFANINQEKSLYIDFTATTSDRLTKKLMEKLELQLRDHLILNIEPIEARFPLEEEGRDILREKLIFEINEFLHSREVKGSIIELKITYVLAN